jgi:predicted nucleotidyltransferase
MLSTEERDRVRERLLSLADTDDAVVGAALTGSHAAGEHDRWSDLDLVLSIRDDPAAVLDSSSAGSSRSGHSPPPPSTAWCPAT